MVGFFLVLPFTLGYQLDAGTEICFSTTSGCYIINNNVKLNETIVYEDNVSFSNLFLPKIYNITGSNYLNYFCFPQCNLSAPVANTTIHFYAEDSSLSLTSSSGWGISEGVSTTITCSANGNVTKVLYRDGTMVANPFSTTLPYGTYNFTCLINDTTGRFTPVSSQKSLSVQSSGFGCTNTNTYAFYKTITPTGELVNLNFTDLVESHYVRSDLADVINTTNVPNVWTNFTDGSYLVVNVTGISSFTVNFGNYIGNQTYENHTQSDNTTAMTGYEELYYYYFFSFYDEKEANIWIPSDVNRTLSLYCEDGESTFTFNDSEILVATVQPIDEAKATVEYSSTSFYYRNLLFDSDVEFRKMYLVDATENEVLQIIMTMQDLTEDFKNSKLKIKKNIESNLETITELNFDAENKAIIYLINGDKYTVTVDNGIEERTIGYLYADSSDLTKTLIIGFIDYTDLTPGNISLSLTFSSIDLLWNDPSNKTNSVSMWVYNVTTNDLLFSATSDNASYIHFTYTVPDVNATYKVRYEVDHQTLGVWSATVFMNGEGAKTIPTDFPLTSLISGLGGNTNIWLALLLILPIPMLFTKRFAAMGGLLLVAIAGLLAYWGIFPLQNIVLSVAFMLAGFLFIKWVSERD